MSERGERRRLPRTAVISTVLVAIGVLLWMFVSRGLLLVAGIGAFGPGILREMGVLRDHDEFQREAARRAGYHAYLAGGLAAILVLSAIEWGAGAVDESAEWVRFVLIVLWLTWLASTLLHYWGPSKTARRVLAAFGAFWAVFVIATLIGDATSGMAVGSMLLGAAMGILIIAPFFGLAWTARRWPRATGVSLLVASLVLLGVFGVRRGGLAWSTRVMTNLLLIGPLLVSGLALLFGWGTEPAAEDGG